MKQDNIQCDSRLSLVSDDFLDKVYCLGYDFYQSGQYKKALDLFQYLLSFNIFNGEYYFAIGACHQQLKEFDFAIDAFFQAAELCCREPKPLFHLAQCFLSLQYLEQAKSVLSMLLQLDVALFDAEQRDIFLQAELLLNAIHVSNNEEMENDSEY